jgi:hypothetical protein
MPEHNKRTFTYADIETFYKKHWKDDDRCTYELKSVHLLPELSPPTWQVEQITTYKSGVAYHFTFILVELRRLNGKPWLTMATLEKIPSGFASVEEEDAEIERQFQAWKKEQEEKKGHV